VRFAATEEATPPSQSYSSNGFGATRDRGQQVMARGSQSSTLSSQRQSQQLQQQIQIQQQLLIQQQQLQIQQLQQQQAQWQAAQMMTQVPRQQQYSGYGSTNSSSSAIRYPQQSGGNSSVSNGANMRALLSSPAPEPPPRAVPRHSSAPRGNYR